MKKQTKIKKLKEAKKLIRKAMTLIRDVEIEEELLVVFTEMLNAEDQIQEDIDSIKYNSEN